MSSTNQDDCITIVYKQVHDIPLLLDLYLPKAEIDSTTSTVKPVPAVIYFHGGGLTVGNRKSWFPSWLRDRSNASGMAFISPDYRLIPPSTGHEVVQDIQDLFKFLSENINVKLSAMKVDFLIDSNAIAVSGSSAGGLCAYLAVMHANPRPKAVVALYAMGGNFLIPHYFKPKSGVFYRGREVLDPDAYANYLHPTCLSLDPIADSKLAYCGPDAPIPGFPANPRMLLSRLYLQLGNYLDFYTGSHDPSLSTALRNLKTENRTLAPEDLNTLLAPHHLSLFPQFADMSSWPPVMLVHGSDDSAVLVEESIHMHELLRQAGVRSLLRVVDGSEHSLDYVKDADILFGKPGGLFDDIRDFLNQHLQSPI